MLSGAFGVMLVIYLVRQSLRARPVG